MTMREKATKNRVYKFRIWDKVKKEMKDWIWICSKDGLLFGNLIIPEKESDFVFMQFTGLHDKNEKEIYGGDIVKNGKGIIYEVKFYNFGFNLDTPEVDGEWMHYTLESYEHIHWSGPSISSGMKEPKHYKDWHLEVIGNIYENKDLLKNEN